MCGTLILNTLIAKGEMMDKKELARSLGLYLDQSKGCYYQSMAIHGIEHYIKLNRLGKAVDEWDYKSLPQSGIGRPKQADLTLLDKNDKLQSLIELQIAYDRPYDVRRLLYDLIKLESVEGNHQVSRLLVIVGCKDAFQKHFKHDGQRGRTPPQVSILPFECGEKKSIEMTTVLPYSQQLLSDYAQKLKVGIPKRISITLVGEYSSDYIGLGIWEVNRGVRRVLISSNFYDKKMSVPIVAKAIIA